MSENVKRERKIADMFSTIYKHQKVNVKHVRGCKLLFHLIGRYECIVVS